MVKEYRWEIYPEIYSRTPQINEEMGKKILRYHIV